MNTSDPSRPNGAPSPLFRLPSVSQPHFKVNSSGSLSEGNPTCRFAIVPKLDQSHSLRQARILAETGESEPSIKVMSVRALDFRSDQAALVLVLVALALKKPEGRRQRLKIGADEFAVGCTAER